MAREAKIITKIDLDKSKFEAGMRSASKSAAKFAATGLKVATAGVVALTAALTAATVATARGIKQVADYGSKLSDVAADTGVTIRELVVLRRAFADAGIEADSTGKTMAKMLKSVFEATKAGGALSTQTRIFDMLGLDPESLSGMDTARQFVVITDAIRDLDTQAARAGASMQIFGRTGNQLLKIGAEGIKSASQNVAGIGELMEKNAPAMDEFADKMQRAFGEAKTSFFAGVFDELKEEILPALREFDKEEFSEAGKLFGQGILAAKDTVMGLKSIIDEIKKIPLFGAGGGTGRGRAGSAAHEVTGIKATSLADLGRAHQLRMDAMASLERNQRFRDRRDDRSGGAPHIPAWAKELNGKIDETNRHLEQLNRDKIVVAPTG